MLLGLLRTDGGTASVFGGDPWRDAADIHRRLAYVPGDVSLWPNLSGGEAIDLLLRMRGVDPRATAPRRAARAVRARPDQEGARLLQGQPAEGRPRRRVRRADADLLVLDEPTSGLDPLMEEVFNECVAEHTAAGTTVLLSSHILSEVERLADRVTIIRERPGGRVGTLDELRHLRRNRVRAEVVGSGAGPVGLPTACTTSRSTGASSPARSTPTGCRRCSTRAHHAGVVSLTSTPPTLEELFLDAYRSDAVERDRRARHRAAPEVRAAP